MGEEECEEQDGEEGKERELSGDGMWSREEIE